MSKVDKKHAAITELRSTVKIGDPYGVHARNTAHLLALLRKSVAGTTLALEGCNGEWEPVHLGDVRSISPMDIFCLDLGHGEELIAVATGPGAEYVLNSVEVALSGPRGRSLKSRKEDWEELWKVTENFTEAHRLMEDVDAAHVAWCFGRLPHRSG